jgi:thiosulfate/3-mercaptopyruvate sulfurtransferase
MKFIFFLLFVFIAGCSSSEPPLPITHNSNALITSDWLEANLHRSDIVLLSLGSTSKSYRQGHIPTARYVDWTQDISDQNKPKLFNILPPVAFEKLAQRLGIEADSTIVLYDNMDSRLSTRMFWMLSYYGHKKLHILDGGQDAWLLSGRTFVSNESGIEPSNYQILTINKSLITYKPYIESRLTDKNFTLVDGRPRDQYTGAVIGKTFHNNVIHKYPGHIYGAQSIPWQENLNANGTFKSAIDLREIYGAHDINNTKTIVTYCNEGLHAAPPWFVLKEILGYQDVRLYDASLAEWANISDLNLVLGEHCM